MGVTLSESLTALVSACILTVTGSVSITEASPAHIDLNPNVSDSITVGESTPALTGACIAGASESISVGEDHTVSNEYLYASTSTPIPIAESITSQVVYLPISESESISTSENVEISPLTPLNQAKVSESVSVGESGSIYWNFATVYVTESVNVEVADPLAAGEIHPSPESVLVSEYEKTEVDLNINVSDGIIVGRTSIYTSDSVAIGEWISPGANIIASESVSVSGVADALVEFLSSVASESIVLSELIETLKHLDVEASVDSISTSDSASASILECNAVVSESISIGDDPNITVGEYAFSVGDSIPITENIDVDITSLPADGEIADAVSIAETVVVWIEITINESESISIGESFVIALSEHEISVSESLSISDPVDIDLWRTFSVADGISISEQVGGVVPTVPVDTSDSISIGEAVVVFRGMDVTDSVTITESVKLRFSYPPTTPTKTHIRRMKEWPYPDFGEFRL